MNKNRLAMVGAATAAALGVGFALMSPAGAVSLSSYSTPTTVQLGSTAVLDARGAVVTVPVSVTCGAGEYAYLNVSLSQRVNGGDAATGNWSENLTCTGETQHFDVAVMASSNAFKNGEAYGRANLYWGGVVDEHTINIVK